MADTSDVETAIVNLIGTVSGLNANIERGWPTEAEIAAAVGSGISLIRVHAIEGLSRDVTRFNRDWHDAPDAAITLTGTLVGFTLTFSGTPAAGQFVGVVSQSIGYTYVVQASDTLDNIAAALAAKIPSASASGAELNLPPEGAAPEFSIEISGESSVEVGRAQQLFCIATWSSSVAVRDSVLAAILANVGYAFRLTLADGSIATLMDLQTTGPEDVTSRAKVWRRDIRVTYDFPITFTQTVPPVTVAELAVTPDDGATFTEYVA